jgi:rod shape-determining protein MreC
MRQNAMASQRTDHTRPIRRLFTAAILVACLLLFLVWRIDSPRVERLRTEVADAVLPRADWLMAPVTGLAEIARDARSYARLHEQNQELRRELQRMQAWKEAALQLEQQNARLLDLNNVRLDPAHTWITGRVLADAGSPFRQSVLLNVGSRDGVGDGWATMDGIGVVGRISGTGERTARVILLTDPASRMPVLVQPSGRTAILQGDNTAAPLVDFLENPDLIRPGDRIVSSGDGGVFPAGLLVGQVARGPDGALRARLAADHERLSFLRVLRARPTEAITDPGELIGPPAPPLGPLAAPEAVSLPLPPVPAVAAGSADG